MYAIRKKCVACLGVLCIGVCGVYAIRKKCVACLGVLCIGVSGVYAIREKCVACLGCVVYRCVCGVYAIREKCVACLGMLCIGVWDEKYEAFLKSNEHGFKTLFWHRLDRAFRGPVLIP